MLTHPLPGETAIAAIVGAFLSILFAETGVFQLESVTDSLLALRLIVIVVGFGIMMHFFCACIIEDFPWISIFFLLGSAVTAVLATFSGFHEVDVDARGAIIILPDTASILLGLTLLVWGVVMLAMTLVRRMVG